MTRRGCLQDGSSLVAGCSDGAVRFYGPQTGQLKRVLEGAHQTAVHAVAMSGDGTRLYSGDASGFFKVWQLGPQSHTMLAALKEHKVVSSLQQHNILHITLHQRISPQTNLNSTTVGSAGCTCMYTGLPA